jgi:chromate reductase
MIKTIAISGSLRQRSYNTAALRAAVELAPAEMSIDIVEIRDLPLYDGDIDGPHAPPAVVEFRQRLAGADAFLLVSPEYNYSIPGPLKNALDWASRSSPGTPNPFAGKPIAIMGASLGMLGTVRMQYHLRQVFVFLDGRVVNKPEVMIGNAREKFDAEGRLIDETARKLIRELLVALSKH